MGDYRYRAVNDAGAVVTGEMTAESAKEARARLRQRGLFPEKVEPSGARGGGRSRWLPFGGGGVMEVTLFTRQLATLLEAGVELVDGIEALSRQCESHALARALADVEEAVRSGKSFGDALAAHPRLFDRSYVGMVASGEKSGRMAFVLSRLADFLERRRLLRAQLSTALIYPAILAIMIVGLLAFISGYVVPMIAPLMRRSGRPMPFSTWLLFETGDFVRQALWPTVAGLVVLVLLIGWLRRSERFRAAQDAAALRLPLLGKLLKKALASRFAMAMAALLRSGVPALEAMAIVEGLTPNAAFTREVSRIRETVAEGKDLSAGLRDSRFFLPMVSYMVAVGERGGALEDVLERVAAAYDFELEIAARRFLAVLEPVLVLIMAAVVGFIAMSLIMGIMQLSHV